MEQTTTMTPQQALALIPRQAPARGAEPVGGAQDGQGGPAQHWLVRRLHEERAAADRARLAELMAAATGGVRTP